MRDMLLHLETIVAPGSTVTMMSHCVPIHERNQRLLEEGLDVNSLKNLKIIHDAGNTSVRRKLEAIPIETYTSVMIFADQLFEADTMHADSHSLATLLLIRDIQRIRFQRLKSVRSTSSTRDSPGSNDECRECPIICEILDPRTQKTIAGNKYVSLSSDFCQSNRLVAQIVAMISEERSVKSLLDELLGVSGCNLAVFPASRYCKVGEFCSFFTVSARARTFGEIVIGYQLARSIEKTILNPPMKDQEMQWDHYDFAVLHGQSDGAEPEEDPEGHKEKAKIRLSQVCKEALAKRVQEKGTQTESMLVPFLTPGDFTSEKVDTKPRSPRTHLSDLRDSLQSDIGGTGGLAELVGATSSMTNPERERLGNALDIMMQLISTLDEKRADNREPSYFITDVPTFMPERSFTNNSYCCSDSALDGDRHTVNVLPTDNFRFSPNGR